MLCMLPSPFVINCIVWVLYTVTEFYKMRECMRTLIFPILKLRQVHQKCQMKFNRGYRHAKLSKIQLTQHQVWSFFQGQTDRQSLKTHKSFMQVAHKYACTHTPACMLIHPSTHTHTTHLSCSKAAPASCWWLRQELQTPVPDSDCPVGLWHQALPVSHPLHQQPAANFFFSHKNTICFF